MTPVQNTIKSKTALQTNNTISKDLAATNLQKAWRGHHARTQVNKLKASSILDKRGSHWIWKTKEEFAQSREIPTHVLQAMTLIIKQKESWDEILIKAEKGTIPVYFLPYADYVLKICPDEETIKTRLEKKRKADEFCAQNGCVNLVVPKASSYLGILVEEKLPIQHVTKIFQIGYYIENCQQLTKAVTQFTHLNLRYNIRHLLLKDSSFVGFGHKKMGLVPRYDNIPFFEDKIGLVDLEHLLEEEELNKFTQLRKMNSLFPLHFNTLCSIAKKENITLSEGRIATLEKDNRRMLVLFDNLYTKYKRFVFRRGIDEKITFSQRRKNYLSEKAIIFLKRHPSNFQRVVQNKKLFSQEFVVFLNKIKKIYNSILCEQKEKNYFPLILENRSFLFRENATKTLYDFWKPFFRSRSVLGQAIEYNTLGHTLFTFVMNQLKGREIYKWTEKNVRGIPRPVILL